MRVPNQLLRETIVVAPYEGDGAHGPLFGNERSMRASAQPTSRLTERTDNYGKTVTVDVLVIIRPEDGPVAPESRVTWRGTTFRVIASYAQPDTRRPYHYELSLSRFGVRTASGSGS